MPHGKLFSQFAENLMPFMLVFTPLVGYRFTIV